MDVAIRSAVPPTSGAIDLKQEVDKQGMAYSRKRLYHRRNKDSMDTLVLSLNDTTNNGS